VTVQRDGGLTRSATATPRVALHVLPLDLGRGAQQYAVSLREQLQSERWDHRILLLFRSESRTVEADEHLDVPQGWLRRHGFDPRVAWRLARRLRADPPDVLIAHGGEPYKYAKLTVPRVTRLMYYRIGVSQPQAQTGLRRLAYRLLSGRTDLVAGVSHETLDDSHELMGIDRGRLYLIPNGRDPRPFDEALAALEADGCRAACGASPHLISVGHLTTGKRPNWFIEVVRRLRGEGIELRATMVGDGPLLEELSAPAAAAGVEVLGHRSDVPELLAAADVFCFTSSGESEGMPGVLIESGLAGLATVATAVAGASTVIEDGRTGLVTAVDDFEAYLDATRALVQADERRSEMGRAARERCRTEFTLEASTNRFQDLLDETVLDR